MKKIITILALFATTVAIYGQEETDTERFSISTEVDLVSSYVWRGVYQTGVSVQPGLSLSAYGATIGAWGSTDFSSTFKELDFFLAYEIGGFSAAITDYWWLGEGVSFFRERGGHLFEASLAYTLSEKIPVSLGVNTMFFGDIDKDADGKRQYSTYITAGYPFSIKNIDCEVGIGISPWKGLYSDKFDVATITAKASKNLRITESSSLPLFVEVIFSPAQDNAYLVFGIRL